MELDTPIKGGRQRFNDMSDGETTFGYDPSAGCS
jgi:hypothetical protein